MRLASFAIAAFILPACDPSDGDVSPRSCVYSEPLNWNDDADDSPSDCNRKMALCIDGAANDACDLNIDDCWAKVMHCVEHHEICWKHAVGG